MCEGMYVVEALCLNVILQKVLIVVIRDCDSMHLTYFLEGKERGSSTQCVDLMSCAKYDYMAQCTRVTRCKILVNNKEAMRFVDVAPPWGEPCIYGVSWFDLCYDISFMHFLSALIMMCNECIFSCLRVNECQI